MIYHSYACRIGKGSQRGMLCAQRFIRRRGKNCWVLKCDIRKFFNSIDHVILKRILSRKIKDKNLRKSCLLKIQRIEESNETTENEESLYGSITTQPTEEVGQ